MPCKSIKLVSFLMIMMLVMAPLRGLWANVIASEMNHSAQVQSVMMEQQESMNMPDMEIACDQCDMKQCCQDSSCNSGHCYSCMAIVSPDFHQPFTQFIQHNQYIYQSSCISFQTPPPLHPPRT